MKKSLLGLALFVISATAQANNFHLIHSDPKTGFKIFRTSRPNEKDMKMFCEQGIQEMMVLSGDAEDREVKYAKACPGLKVIYNKKQSESVPVTEEFLKNFDAWVKDAQVKGKKIAFRCRAGAHRTGRLAAYYQMKYQGLAVDDAKVILNKYGVLMWYPRFRHVKDQVTALKDYIDGAACSTKSKYCVRREADSVYDASIEREEAEADADEEDALRD